MTKMSKGLLNPWLEVRVLRGSLQQAHMHYRTTESSPVKVPGGRVQVGRRGASAHHRKEDPC